MSKTDSTMRVAVNTQRAFSSVLSPASWPIIIGAILASVLVVAGLWWFSSWLISWLVSDYVGEEWFWGWFSLDWLTTFLQGAAAFGLAWGLFPLLIPVFISVFVNQLAKSIEKREYADKPQGKDLPFIPELKMDIGFAAYAIVINVLLLPVYLIPGLNLIIYYVINAHLLGKQYFMMISRRHLSKEDLGMLAYKHRTLVYVYGLIIVLLSTVPILNLIGPAFATAMMVHVFQSVNTLNEKQK